MRNMERHFDRMERDLNSAFGSFFKPMTAKTPLTVYEAEAPGKYQLNVVMGEGFKPENIKVTLKDHEMRIEAKYDHTSEDGKSRVYQEFTRTFPLPKAIDQAQVKSLFTPEGVLQIEAPLPEPEVEAKPVPKEIPISVEA
jgi:HSP20 family molecular chaperone IbpA